MTEATTQQATIDLQRFCAKDDPTKYLMDRPFVRDGWRYATDGRILVRIDAGIEADTPDEPGKGKFPDCAELIAASAPPVDAVWMPWPTDGMVREVECCPQCRGKGDIICASCDEYVSECLMCNGAEQFEQDIRFELGKHVLLPKYAKLVATLPNVRVYADAKELSPIPFVFDGGEGRLMGMTPGSRRTNA